MEALMTNLRTYEVGPSRVTLRFGDILESTAQVIVSFDDYMLTRGGGVSKAISRAAGVGMIVDVEKSIPRHLGDVVVTSAGLLHARYVFHVITIGPPKLGGPTDAEESIRTAVGRCLDLLEPLDVQSIAFPALGTGAARYSVEKTASLMAVEIIDRLENSTHMIDASLWLHARSGMSELDFVAFYEEFARSQPRLTESKLIETRIEVNEVFSPGIRAR